MDKMEIMDQDLLRKNAMLIPIAVIIGTAIAIAAYMFLPTYAMGLILVTSIIVTYILLNKIKKNI